MDRAGHPLLYEVNTRQWLAGLAHQRGRDMDLFSVPEDELDRLEALGTTHLWLMGVWPTGPKARKEALHHADLRKAYDSALPGWTDEDVLGSPYAIAAFHVSPLLGGDAGLEALRSRLDERNIKLILDFVPNHLGLDHQWVQQRSELFVRSLEPIDGAVHIPNKGWLAHGKDPHFPGWTDTVQLDYRRADTREAMTGALRAISERCDGVRCDMSMLALDDVFFRTWAHVPLAHDAPRAEGDFWARATATVRAEHPSFLFLAEVYWDLEHRLCELGFDHAYDKKLYDLIVHDKPAEISAHLLGLGDANRRRAHFLENHDEPRAAAAVPADLHRAAALLTLGLPGMRFVHDGQLEGRRTFSRVQLARHVDEPRDEAVSAMYQNLLADLQESAVGRGQPHLLSPRRGWAENDSSRFVSLVQWQPDGRDDRFDLVVVNASAERAQCWAPLDARGLGGGGWTLVDRIGSERWERSGDELATRGLYLDLAPRAAQLFAFRRS